MNKRDLSPEDFEQLLNWLDPDPQRAGEKYESIRRGLTALFDNWKCLEADSLADETINRVLTKVPNIAPTYSGDPALYFYGTAKRVRYEQLRRPRPEPLMPNTKIVATPAADRELILEYYRGDKNVKITCRRQLGERAGVSSSALRVRIFRLRGTLEECISKCLNARITGNRSQKTSLYAGGPH